jgi:flagellar basal-body rod protein FlgF/flagellar basal-body rod protein FlgG
MSNNLANAQTTGYRAGSTTFQSLLAARVPETLPALNRAVNDFGVLGNSLVDLSPGSLEHTGGQLDLALEGKGFFVIQASTANPGPANPGPVGQAAGQSDVFYTRNGGFQVSAQGRLVTADGHPVLGEQGPLQLPSGNVVIAPDGTISVNGLNAGKIRVVEFAAGTPLKAEGSSYYSASSGSALPGKTSAVRQGLLESSNVNTVTAAVDLVAVQREAEMLQRALSIFNTEFQRIAAQDLPRV